MSRSGSDRETPETLQVRELLPYVCTEPSLRQSCCWQRWTEGAHLHMDLRPTIALLLVQPLWQLSGTIYSHQCVHTGLSAQWDMILKGDMKPSRAYLSESHLARSQMQDLQIAIPTYPDEDLCWDISTRVKYFNHVWYSCSPLWAEEEYWRP